MKGYITFINDEKIQEGDKLKRIEGTGYIVYSSIADSLRGLSVEDEKKVALVEVLGQRSGFDSEYYGYYNMICTDKIKILSLLSEEEIMAEALRSGDFQTIRLIQGYKIPEEYVEKLAQKGLAIWQSLEYYQKGNKKIYDQSSKELVKKYGQNNYSRGERK